MLADREPPREDDERDLLDLLPLERFVPRLFVLVLREPVFEPRLALLRELDFFEADLRPLRFVAITILPDKITFSFRVLATTNGCV